MAKFAYNNANNSSTGLTPFELNCGYYPQMLYKEDVEFHSQFKLSDKLLAKPRELIIVWRKDLHYTQKLQKQAYNKRVQPRSYTSGEKVWLNSKYINTKRNRKLEVKFLGPFRVFHPIGKQAYKL